MIFRILFILLVFGVVQNSYAGLPPHKGNSVVSFHQIAYMNPKASLFITDSGGDHDIPAFRDPNAEYELEFEVQITQRTEGLDKLIANELIEPTFKIYIPANDVDQFPPTDPIDCEGDGIDDPISKEIDEVYFNGRRLKTKDGEDAVLGGGNNIWAFNSNIFEVELSEHPLNLPEFNADGTIKEGTGVNTIGIKIDQGNKQYGEKCRIWSTTVDYVAIGFKVAEPIILLPGAGGEKEAYDNSGFKEAMNNAGVSTLQIGYDTPIGNGECEDNSWSSMDNVSLLTRTKLEEEAKFYGSRNFNLIGWSKGGIDAVKLIYDLKYNPIEIEYGNVDGVPITGNLKINSLATIGSPHLGTPMALATHAKHFTNISFLPDVCQMSTDTMKNYNRSYRVPTSIPVFTIGNNADTNENGYIDSGDLSDTLKIKAGFYLSGSPIGITILNFVDPTGVDVPGLTEHNSGFLMKNDSAVPVWSAHSINSLNKKSYSGYSIHNDAGGVLWVNSMYNGRDIILEEAKKEHSLNWRKEEFLR